MVSWVFRGGFDDRCKDFLDAGSFCQQAFGALGAKNVGVPSQTEPVDGFAGLFRGDAHLGFEIRPALRGLGFFNIRADARACAPELGSQVVFFACAHDLGRGRNIQREAVTHFQNRIRFFHSKFKIRSWV